MVQPCSNTRYLLPFPVRYTNCILTYNIIILTVHYTNCILTYNIIIFPVRYTNCILTYHIIILPVRYTNCILTYNIIILPVRYTNCILFLLANIITKCYDFLNFFLLCMLLLYNLLLVRKGVAIFDELVITRDKRVTEIFSTACSIVYKYCTRPISKHLYSGIIKYSLDTKHKIFKKKKTEFINVMHHV